MTDTSKTAKIIKRWYHSTSHRLTVNVLLNNINFLWFLLFSMCHSLHVAVNQCIADVLYIYICCFSTIGLTKFLCWWSIINHLLSTAMKTLNLRLNVLGSRFWSLGVTWRHRNVTIGLGVSTFLLVVNDDHAPILHGYGDTGFQRFWGHEFDFLRSRDVISHITIGLGICGFLLVVHCNHASILHRYGDIKSQSCICPC